METWNNEPRSFITPRFLCCCFPRTRGGTDVGVGLYRRVVAVLSEAAVQQRIRLEAPKNNCVLWRNNNGACESQDGRLIRYGLANDSAKINREFKSSDLIGVSFQIITPEMIGQTVGIFTSIEVKREGWHYTGTDREQAQNAWCHLIKQYGGIAGFATGPGNIWPGY